jgi:nitroimidazol reductase NimA-like FMN-containing flavoprotein (pyridoxamine 5'-phosphate oxidase superfamily)
MSNSDVEVREHSGSPEAERPWMPDGYGVPADNEGVISWGQIEDLLKGALNYWIATTSESGKPHVRPVWGGWIGDTLYFDGSPATRWGRNIEHNPAISIQVEVEDYAIILEGKAHGIDSLDEETANTLAAQFDVKYKERYNHTTDPQPWIERGTFVLKPDVVYAWDVAQFPRSATRWRFNAAGKKEGE